MNPSLHNLAAGLHERLLDGEVDGEGRRWLQRHRAGCPACDAAFARLERITRALEELERYEPRAGFAERVLAQVRPAPLPAWARWRVAGGWQRAAAAAVLLGGGLIALVTPLLAGLVLGDAGNLALLFRWPVFAAEGLVALLRSLDPFRALLETGAVLAGILRTIAATPQVIGGLVASAVLSATALRQLSHLLVAPAARR
ncbi:MAG: anti-sigma factor [Gemmatimonadota bacterium]